MNWRSKPLALVCLIGFLTGLIFTGVLLLAMQRVLLQTTATDYTILSGEAEWQGDWKFSELGADPSETGSQTGADRVTISFTGTDLALHVRREDYRGNFFVSVDGQPANQLPWEERGAYLVLASPDYAPQVVFIPVVSGLDNGPHEAVVIADRGWDQWPLVGWRVSRTPDTTAYRWAMAGLGVLGCVCLGGAVWGASGVRRQGSKETRGEREATRHSPFAIRRSPFIILVVASVFYFSPWLPLTLISGLALAALIFVQLDLGLALVAATAPFYMHPRLLFGKAFSMAEITMLLCVASWGIRQIFDLRSLTSTLRSPTFLDLATLLFALVAIASTLAADYRHVALRELRIVVLEPTLFYLMLRTSHLNDKAIWRIVDFFVLGGVVVAVIGLVQFGLGVNIITAEEGFRRLRSVYGSPNNAGLYLGRVLPVLVAVALFGAARGRRVAYGSAVLPVGLALLLSFSKGALILGVPLSLLALGVLAGGPWLRASLGAVAAAVVAAIPLLRTPRFASLFDTGSGTTFFRLQLWRSSWMMFCDHLWLGVGPDNFLYQYRGRYILPAAWQEPDLSHPHNVLLDYGCRLGLGGLAAGIWLQAAFWQLALPLRHLTDRNQRALVLGLIGSMVNFLAHGMVDASYFVIDLAFAFFLTLGVVQWLALERLASKRRKTDELEI
jgi:O-antigen ligase